MVCWSSFQQVIGNPREYYAEVPGFIQSATMFMDGLMYQYYAVCNEPAPHEVYTGKSLKLFLVIFLLI